MILEAVQRQSLLNLLKEHASFSRLANVQKIKCGNEESAFEASTGKDRQIICGQTNCSEIQPTVGKERLQRIHSMLKESVSRIARLPPNRTEEILRLKSSFGPELRKPLKSKMSSQRVV
jgi:hypothetical protein